jgi:hypothetical protein
MKKQIPGFSGAGLKEGKIGVGSGGKVNTPSQPKVGNGGGKGGMPQGGLKPAKVKA